MISRPLHNLWSSTLSLNAMPSDTNYGTRQQQTYGVPFRRSKSVRNLNVYDGSDEDHAAGRRHLRRIVLRRSSDMGTGLGFSIRGGRELGIGIFVSKVVERSVADLAGLLPGDEILSVNETSFEDVSHEEAIKILKAAPRLAMLVCSTGRVPGSCVVHQTYTWLDSEGRSVSPPPEYDHSFYSSPAHRKAVSRLHHTPRIRKVTMRIDKGQSLGLMIRGGVEYGLGVYITGVDKNSVADVASLKVGDQILEVNNQSFLDITHDEAVRVLKYSPVMVMTIREVGKVPYSCTTYDENSTWMYDRDVAVTSRSPRLLRKGYLASGIDACDNLVHTIDMQALRILNEKAKLVLTKPELATLNYYRIEYERGQMTIDSFVAVLLELFETEEKYALLQDIREVIHPLDLHKFDELIYKKDLEMARTRQRLGRDDRSSRNRFSSVSMDHLTSHVATPSPRSTRRDLNSRYETVHDPNMVGDPLQSPVHHGLQQSRDPSRHQMSRVGRRHHGLLTSYHHSTMTGGEYGPEYHEDDMRTPSEDSGVDSTNGSYYTTNRASTAMMRETSGSRPPADRWQMPPGQGYERLQHRSAEEHALRGRVIPRRHSGDEELNYSEIQAQQHQQQQQGRSTERRWSIGSEQSEVPGHYDDPSYHNIQPQSPVIHRYPKWRPGRSSNRYGYSNRSSSLPRP